MIIWIIHSIFLHKKYLTSIIMILIYDTFLHERHLTSILMTLVTSMKEVFVFMAACLFVHLSACVFTVC